MAISVDFVLLTPQRPCTGTPSGRLHFPSPRPSVQVCGLSVLSGGTLEERLRLIFDAFDTERVGHLGPEQVRLMMQHDMWRQDHGPTQSPAVPHRRHRNGEQDDEGIEMQPMGPDCDRDLAHMVCS